MAWGEDTLLAELRRETHLKVLYPQMLTTPRQGLLMQMISHMIRPRTILEIGTFTGYGSICLARGLAEDGLLHTFEVNDELHSFSRKYFHKAGLQNRIIQYTGRAQERIPELDIQPELVYIDGDKREYTGYYDAVVPVLKKGGYILADNVLWNGKVTDPSVRDPHTLGIRAFNEQVRSDTGMKQIILPLEDGLLLAEKQ